MRALIIGCGYLGRRVAERWIAGGHEVHALTRSVANADRLQESGVHPIIGDVLDRDCLNQLPESDVLLHAVGFDRADGHSKEDVYVRGLRNVLSAVSGRVNRVVYVSSTSVYGQSDASWIDEHSPCQPTSEGGRICLSAEQLLHSTLEQSASTTATILRLAGLYGPGRLIGRIDQLMAAAPVAGNSEAWLNLIHVDDAARCVIAAAELQEPSSLYLVSDDQPVRRREFYGELARLVGAPVPTFDSQAPVSRGPGGLGKRCRNAMMHSDLVQDLAHPCFRDGLASAVEARHESP